LDKVSFVQLFNLLWICHKGKGRLRGQITISSSSAAFIDHAIFLISILILIWIVAVFI
jgi:hypothetical protein